MRRLLVLPVLVLAIATSSGCTANPAPPSDPPASAESPSATPTVTAVDAAAYLPGGPIDAGPEFMNPSGTTVCSVPGAGGSADFRAACSVAEHSWSFSPCDPEAPICPRFIVIDDAGTVAEGANGGAVTSYEAGTPVKTLEVGSSLSYGGVTCTSAADAVICEDEETGHGFRLSAAENTWF
jgi:hypothetical protein